MRKIEVYQQGDKKALRMVESDVPSPKAKELLIKAEAIGVNFAEVVLSRDHVPFPIELPFVPGYEIAGTVAEVGEGCSGWRKGDRAVAMLYPKLGAYAEYAVAEVSNALHVHDALEFSQAGALLSQGMTAWGLLDTVYSKKGAVLVHSAAGGVGIFLVQLAKQLEPSLVIGAASTLAKRELVERLGADITIDYTAPDWQQQVRDATGDLGVEYLFDAVGGALFESALSLLAPRGHIACYGLSSGTPPSLSPRQMMDIVMKSQSITGFSLFSMDDQAVQRGWNELTEKTIQGRLEIPLKTFPLAEARTALDMLSSRATTGKLVLVP